MLVGVDAAVVLLQLQMVATVCSAGVYDYKVAWLGWLQVGDGCDITW